MGIDQTARLPLIWKRRSQPLNAIKKAFISAHHKTSLDEMEQSRGEGAMTTTDMTRVKLMSGEEVNQTVDRVLKVRWYSRLGAAIYRLQQRVFGRCMSSRP